MSDQGPEPRKDSLVRSLWRGEVPLGRAFWWYTVILGSLLNLLTTVLFMMLLAFEVPPALAFVAYVFPVPYNLFILFAVWRSADSYRGSPEHALLARVTVTLWAVVASVS